MNDWFPIHAVMPAYFVAALTASPQWSSANESHIYRWTSPFTHVEYASPTNISSYDPVVTV